jgi:hypothetical protein
VKVFFDIRGREWKENYYVNLNAWKIESVDGGSGGAPDNGDGPPLREPEMGAGEVDEEPPF